MAKKINKSDSGKQLEKRLRAALGSILHTQTAVKAVLDQAEGSMDEGELAGSRLYGIMCRYDAQCEEVFMELCGELSDTIRMTDKPYHDNTEGSQRKSLPEVVSSKELLRVVGSENYQKLVRARKLNILRPDASGIHALIATDSIPNSYRQLLEALYQTDRVSDTHPEEQSI